MILYGALYLNTKAGWAAVALYLNTVFEHLLAIVYLNTISNSVFEHYECGHYVDANGETSRIVQVCIYLVKKCSKN